MTTPMALAPLSRRAAAAIGAHAPPGFWSACVPMNLSGLDHRGRAYRIAGHSVAQLRFETLCSRRSARIRPAGARDHG